MNLILIIGIILVTYGLTIEYHKSPAKEEIPLVTAGPYQSDSKSESESEPESDAKAIIKTQSLYDDLFNQPDPWHYIGGFGKSAVDKYIG